MVLFHRYVQIKIVNLKNQNCILLLNLIYCYNLYILENKILIQCQFKNEFKINFKGQAEQSII